MRSAPAWRRDASNSAGVAVTSRTTRARLRHGRSPHLIRSSPTRHPAVRLSRRRSAARSRGGRHRAARVAGALRRRNERAVDQHQMREPRRQPVALDDRRDRAVVGQFEPHLVEARVGRQVVGERRVQLQRDVHGAMLPALAGAHQRRERNAAGCTRRRPRRTGRASSAAGPSRRRGGCAPGSGRAARRRAGSARSPSRRPACRARTAG